MKVLLVAANFAPEFEGGTEKVTASLARDLTGLHGDEVVVVAGSERPLGVGEDDVLRETWHPPGQPDAHVRVLRLRRRPDEPYDLLVRRPRIREVWQRLLAEERPDVVHVHGLATLTQDLLRTARVEGVRTVWTFHDLWVTCPRFFRLHPDGVGTPCPEGADRAGCVPCVGRDVPLPAGALRGLLAQRDRDLRAEVAAADVLTAPSRSAAESVRRHLPTDRPIEVVPHGLLDAAPRAPATRSPRSGPVVVGTFGNLVPEKGVGLLVEACARLAGEGAVVPFRLALHGRFLDPAYEDELRRRADAAGLEFECAGPYGADRPHPATALDLAVFPSLCAETYGLVVDEALGRGVPVVVSDRGALPERVVAGGRVVPVTGDGAGHLARVLRELLADGAFGLRSLAAEVPERWPVFGEAAARYRTLYRLP